MARKTAGDGRGKRWSRRVTATSDALDLEGGVFRRSPRQIAASLKRSAERSRRRKGTPFQSAMAMLNFYVNRAGRKLGAPTRARLERAKEELRDLFGRERSPLVRKGRTGRARRPISARRRTRRR